MTSVVFAATLLAPLLLVWLLAGAGAFGSVRLRLRLRRILVLSAPLAVVPAIGLALLAGPASVGEASRPRLDVVWLLLGTHFAVDAWSRGLLLVAALLYGGALGTIGWVRSSHAEPRLSALCGFLLMAYLGNIGSYLAADAVIFYLCFATMSFSAVGLVVHYRTRAAHRATRIYLVLSVLSETSILAALLLTVSAGALMLVDAPTAVAGSANSGLIVALLLFGFGVKAGTMPLHVWLPLAHPAAPPAASAVLSGAMVKAGIIGWLRFLPSADSPGESAVPQVAGWVLLALALVGAFAAVLFGVLQNDPKVILAYSTISQLGFITAVVAVGMVVPGLYPATSAAAVIYSIHHGLAKGALFLGVPVLKHFGHGPAGLIATLGMALAGLALAGAPLTSGALGKYVSKGAVDGVAFAGIELTLLLALIASGSTLLLMRLAVVLGDREPVEPRRIDGEYLCWLAVVIAAVAVPGFISQAWYSDDVLAVSLPSWDAATIWDAAWPILLGIVLGAVFGLLGKRGKLPLRLAAADGSLIRPGDLIVPEERALKIISVRGGRALTLAHTFTAGARELWVAGWGRIAGVSRRAFSWAEKQLARWETSGAAILLVLALAVVLSVGRIEVLP